MSELEPLIQIGFFVFGCITGSFLNVCIVRMPYEKSVVKPPSHCPSCKKDIPWYDNIPLFSYVLLRGKCRSCGAKFSIRYFFVELLTGLMFLGMYYYYGLEWIVLPYIVMMSCFIVATFVDFGHRIIPDEISVGGMCIGIVLSLFIPEMHGTDNHWLGLGRSLLGVLVGGGSIYAMGVLGDIIFKKESMGGGDVKLLALVGAFLGWKASILAFFIAPFFGAIFGIAEKIRTNDTTIAYGPFLVLGAIISLFWEEPIINWILSGYGLY